MYAPIFRGTPFTGDAAAYRRSRLADEQDALGTSPSLPARRRHGLALVRRESDLPRDLDDVAGLSPLRLAEMLELLDLEIDRLAIVRRAIVARLREALRDGADATRPLVAAKEAARRLGVSIDYVRKNGERLGIAVPLGDGVTRYDPEAIERLRRARARRLPPRD